MHEIHISVHQMSINFQHSNLICSCKRSLAFRLPFPYVFRTPEPAFFSVPLQFKH